MEDNKVTVNVKVENIDESVRKAKELIELLKKAKTMVDELALVDFKINL